MNLSLQQAIYNKLTGITSNVYYKFFPSTFTYRTDFGLMYDLPNTDNVNTFDGKELGKTYSLQITVNGQNSDYLLASLAELKSNIYSLERVHARSISLVNEEMIYVDELNTYNLFVEFQIK